MSSKARAQANLLSADGTINLETITPVDSDRIADGSISTDKLQNSVVHTDNLQDGAVHTDKIQDGSVTSAKIDPAKVTQWDSAYGWGDHALAGYADSASVQGQIDAINTELVSDTTPQLGGTLDANGNDIDMGINTITDAKVGQWDSAYGWGDHSLAGYADSASVQSQIDGISVTPTQVSDQNNTSTGFFDLPAGTTAERPGSPGAGYLRYNTDNGNLEQYTSDGWQAIEPPPVVTVVSPSSFNGASGTSFTITGQGFKSGATVQFITVNGTVTNAATTTFVDGQEVTATTAQDFTVADEPLSVKLANPSGLASQADGVIDCGGVPAWSTAAGSLGTIYDSQRGSKSFTVSATDPDSQTVSYAVTSGALPTGMSLNSSSGVISGTPNAESSDTTYSFTITASDPVGNDTPRAFSILVKAPTVVSLTSVTTGSWSVPTGVSSVRVMVIAGGGGGGSATGFESGGGGGAGGLVHHTSFPVTPGGSVSYRVGGGGTNATNSPSGTGPGPNGSGTPSYFGPLTAIGGGQGGGQYWTGRAGGSGGGEDGNRATGPGPGPGTQPGQSNPGATNYGNPGGRGSTGNANAEGGGGGGAGEAGNTDGQQHGGDGVNIDITGSSITYAGGGGGAGSQNGSAGGPGGSGGGGAGTSSYSGNGTPGTNNKGGGGGGSCGPTSNGSGTGGSGVVIIRF